MPIKIQPKIEDDDLKFLAEMSNAELEILYKIIVVKGKLTERLSANKKFKRFYPDHSQYADLIAQELIAFGSHTFFFKKNYAAIVRDVCEKMEVSHGQLLTVEQLEQNLLSKVLEQSWENMSDAEKRELLDSIGEKDLAVSGGAFDVLLAMFRAGGNPSMQLALSIVGSIGEMILGDTFKSIIATTGGAFLLEGATTFAAERVVAALTGPVGIALTAVWALKSLGGPAYRVTVPAVIYIAGMRMLHAHHARTRNNAKPISLKRRHKEATPLPDKIRLGFGWTIDDPTALDVVTFLLDENGRVRSDADFIFYNQPVHLSGALAWTEDVPRGSGDVQQLSLDFSLMPPEIQSIKIFLVIEGNNFARASDMSVRLIDGDSIERRSLIGDFDNAASIEVGTISRRGNDWFFETTPRGTDMELIDICKKYGVNVE